MTEKQAIALWIIICIILISLTAFIGLKSLRYINKKMNEQQEQYKKEVKEEIKYEVMAEINNKAKRAENRNRGTVNQQGETYEEFRARRLREQQEKE